MNKKGGLPVPEEAPMRVLYNGFWARSGCIPSGEEKRIALSRSGPIRVLYIVFFGGEAGLYSVWR